MSLFRDIHFGMKLNVTKTRRKLTNMVDIGNGTQRLTNDDRDVLYVSLHRYDNQDFYPCDSRGSEIYCGSGNGKGR